MLLQDQCCGPELLRYHSGRNWAELLPCRNRLCSRMFSSKVTLQQYLAFQMGITNPNHEVFISLLALLNYIKL